MSPPSTPSTGWLRSERPTAPGSPQWSTCSKTAAACTAAPVATASSSRVDDHRHLRQTRDHPLHRRGSCYLHRPARAARRATCDREAHRARRASPHATPSTAARANCARRDVGAEPADRFRVRPDGSGCVRRRSTAATPGRPAVADSASSSNSAWSTPRSRRTASSHLRGVGGADQRKESTRSRRRTRRPLRSGRPSAIADTAYTVPDVPIDITASPGRSPTPSAAAMLSPGPRSDDRAVPLPCRRPSGRGPSARRRPVTCRRSTSSSRSHRYSPTRRRPVARCPMRRLDRSCTGRSGVRVSSSCGSRTRASFAQASGWCPMQPGQLGDGERRDRHAADRIGPRRRATELLDQPVGVGSRLRVVPEFGRVDRSDRRRRARPCRVVGPPR